jgi:hypothetical protein
MASQFETFKQIFEQATEWSPDLPTPVKGGNGPRFAAGVDLPVQHDVGFTLPLPARRKVKARKSPAVIVAAEPTEVPPLGFTLAEARLDSPNPAARFVAFAVERERIRKLKEAGAPKPWTENPILADRRFCNVHREHDAVTRWVTAHIVEPHRSDLDLWFRLAAARLINEPKTLIEVLPYLVPFDAAKMRTILGAREARGETIWRGVYRSSMARKGQSRIDRLVEEILAPLWRDRERLRPRFGDTLTAYCARLEDCTGMGPFLAAQVIADLKYLLPLNPAPDWWTFAAPGPGSMQGLNRVRGREVKAGWNRAEWYRELMILRAETAPLLAAAGIEPLDAQNQQNCCCEFDKFERWTAEVASKPAQESKPARKRKAKTSPHVELVEQLPDAPAPAQREAAKFLNDLDSGPPRAESAPVVEPAESAVASTEGTPPVEPAGIEPGAAPPEAVVTEGTAALERGQHRGCLEAALAFAANGWRIFPSPPGSKRSYKSMKVHGGARWGATNNPDEVRRDFTRWPQANIGLPTGLENKIWVLEADTKKGNHQHDGLPALHALTDWFGPLPETLMAESPSGSRHFYFRWPQGQMIRNSTGEIGPGLDVRGEGGMVIAPPSLRDGVAYRWINETKIAAALSWLLELVTAGSGTDTEAHVSNGEPQATIPEIKAALDAIPIKGMTYQRWISIGHAVHAASGGSDKGLALFDAWTKQSPEYDAEGLVEKWQSFHPHSIGMGSLVYLADEADPTWRDRLDAQAAAKLQRANFEATGGSAKDSPQAPKSWRDVWVPAPIRAWAGSRAPAQEYVVGTCIPVEQLFLFSGEGGDGKSIMLEHLCAAHAIGRDWLGFPVRQGLAVYIECEDAMTVLRRRLESVAEYYAVPIESFATQLTLLSLIEHDTILAATNRLGIVQPTAAYGWLRELAGDLKPVHIGLASAANIFAGNELVRTEVQQFAKLMNQIAKVAGGAVSLVTHPSLTGLSDNNVSHAGLSGSTQWHNAVRGRLVTKSVKTKVGEGLTLDTGLRSLTFHKNQYGPPTAGLMLRWQGGLFLPVAGGTHSEGERAAAAEDLALVLLQRFTAQNRNVSINPNPHNYAPREFEQTAEAEAAGFTAKEFKRALNDLLTRGVVENVETPGGHGKHGGRPCLRIKTEETKP